MTPTPLRLSPGDDLTAALPALAAHRPVDVEGLGVLAVRGRAGPGGAPGAVVWLAPAPAFTAAVNGGPSPAHPLLAAWAQSLRAGGPAVLPGLGTLSAAPARGAPATPGATEVRVPTFRPDAALQALVGAAPR